MHDMSNALTTLPKATKKQKSSTVIEVDDIGFSYDHGKTETLKGISMTVPKNQVTALIGPSGCGKSTLLRCLNRMNDLIDTAKITRGTIRILGQDIHAADVDAIELRKQVGMVFQWRDGILALLVDSVGHVTLAFYCCCLMAQGIRSPSVSRRQRVQCQTRLTAQGERGKRERRGPTGRHRQVGMCRRRRSPQTWPRGQRRRRSIRQRNRRG